MAAPSNKFCNACGSEIPGAAKLCPICKTYQNRCWALIQWLSASIALIVAVVSLTFWIVSQLPTVRRVIWPKEDVQAVAASTIDRVVIANRGDEEVFVSQVRFFMTGRSTWTAPGFPVDQNIAPGKLLRVERPGQLPFDEGQFIRGIDPKDWDAFIDHALADRSCFLIVIFATIDPLYRDLQSASQTTALNTLGASGYIEYFSATKPNYRRQVVPAVGTIWARSVSDCLKKIPKPLRAQKDAGK
jgi:hypothetical protein